MTPCMRAATAALALGGLLAGCEDDPPDPNLVGGAGLRFTFPAGTDTLDGVRVELWHRNSVLPPACIQTAPAPGSTRAASSLSTGPSAVFVPAASTGDPDSCTRMSIRIWNLIGKPVRAVADTPFVDRLAWGWDKLDDRGEPVPSGYYPVFSKCLDSRGSFSFSGHYDVLQDREFGSCEWPLWIEALDPAPGGARSFGPFPDAVGTVLLGPNGEWQKLVNFLNPFLVRAHAAGMETFETEVVLVEGRYSDVAVAWTPLVTQEVGAP